MAYYGIRPGRKNKTSTMEKTVGTKRAKALLIRLDHENEKEKARERVRQEENAEVQSIHRRKT